ncbi:MAG: FecR domain-containing protein [Pseudomonadota bacterium]
MKSALLFLTLQLFFMISYSTYAQDNQSLKPVGKIAQSEGRVQILSANSHQWEEAHIGMKFFSGDRLMTGSNGWAALLMLDESIIQLNKNSILIFKQVAQKAGWIERVQDKGKNPDISEYFLKKGRIWLRNKNINQHIDIHTPYVSTSIRGTELDIWMHEDLSIIISVLEGQVLAQNEQGTITLDALEQIVAYPGQPMQKSILINPEEAVQWTISFQPTLEMLFTLIKETESNQKLWHPLFSGKPQLFIDANGQNDDPTVLAGIITSYALLREYTIADKKLSMLREKWPNHLPGVLLEILLSLFKNDITAADKASQKALQIASGEPACHVLNAWVRQAQLDLTGALASTLAALQLNKNYIPGLLNLSRLKLADGFIEDSFDAVQRVLALAPNHPEALNLKGFLMLTMQKDQFAIKAFKAAIKLNPYMGEPHLGLCLAYMRKGNEEKAQEEITIAVLLEPQRSAFLSYWAKMLYEKKRFKQALDILDLAQRLDPNDPTPWLYRSHVLRDLNRIHEAIRALQTAVSLNNNQAIYKSRFFLDQDLAVQNVNLAELYKKLGVSEWGSVKAMASMKKDNNNFAAHDFVAGQLDYLHGPSSLGARSSRTKAFLMKPANANAFNSFNNYTLFFDQPDIDGKITGWMGNYGYWNSQIYLNGALPEANTAFEIKAQKGQHDGWQTYDWQEFQKVEASVKWDMTYKDTLSLQTEHYSLVTGDLSSQTVYDAQPDSQNHTDTDLKFIRAGYVRKNSPNSNFFLLVQREYKHHLFGQTHLTGSGTALPFDYTYDYNKYEWLDDPFTNIQAMQTLKMADHDVSVGLFWYESDRDYTIQESTSTDYYWAGTNIFVGNTLVNSELGFVRPRKMQSAYVQDIWNPSDAWTIEAALYADKINNVNSQYELTWSESYLNPRFGLTFRPTLNDTIAFSYKKFLETFESVARIDAIEVAGHVLPSFFEGSVTQEVALSWGHEWSTGLFVAKTFVNEPDYQYLTTENGQTVQKELDQKYVGAEMAVNQLLFDDMALAAGFIFFSIDRDRVTPLLEGENKWYWTRLTKAHSSGLSASIGTSYYDTDYDSPTQQDRDFLFASTYLEYELPQKRGKLRFEIHNIFDKHFNGVPLSNLAGLIPNRTYALMVEVNF